MLKVFFFCFFFSSKVLIFGGSYGVLGLEPEFVPCKASALPVCNHMSRAFLLFAFFAWFCFVWGTPGSPAALLEGSGGTLIWDVGGWDRT